MKKKTMFATAAVLFGAIAVCTSCNDDKKEIPVNDGRVQFTSSIAQASEDGNPLSRASGIAWTNGDAIGIYMVEHNSTPPAVSMGAANKKYITNTSGELAAAPNNAIYYPQTGAVDFIAYYPYVATATLATPLDVSVATTQTADNQPTFDLLWAKVNNGGAGYAKTYAGKVALAFDHKLAKMNLNTIPGAGLQAADLNGMSVKIKGMKTAGTFNLSTGDPVTATGTAVNIIPRTATDGAVYDAIIMPETYAVGALTVEFTITGGDTFVWNVSPMEAITFEPGKEYTYTITIARTAISVTATINSWITATGTGTAE